MGFITEKQLKQNVDSMINARIKLSIETKIKKPMVDMKEYVFEKEKYYSKKDIDNCLVSQIDIITKMFSDQIHADFINIGKIKSKNIYGRGVEGPTLFSDEDIEPFVNDVFSKVLF